MKANQINLHQEEKKLIAEWENLNNEEKGMETVIQCQVRKNEITVRKKELERRLYAMKSELLKENENYESN